MEFTCPNCEVKFAASTLNSVVQSHLQACMKKQKQKEEEKNMASEAFVPSKHEKVVLNYDIQDYYYVKEPVDDSYTQFKWQKAAIKLIQPNVYTLAPEQVEGLCFQEKSAWFRYNL